MKHKHLTEQEFTYIKGITQIKGIKVGMIKSITKRSSYVVHLVRRSETFADYLKLKEEYIKKYKKVEAKSAPKTVEQTPNQAASSYMEVLQSIDASLKKLVQMKHEGIEYAKNHKKWFFQRDPNIL